MPADNVIGQPDFASNTVQATATGVNDPQPGDVAVIGGTRYLIVGDTFNHRVLFYDLSSGITNGMAAVQVLGQPDLFTNTQNTLNASFGCSTVPNACGLGTVSGVGTFDGVSKRLFVVDAVNNRVIVFDLSSGITNGMAASWVLGQTNFTTATPNTACGGGSSGTPNACGLIPSGRTFFDSTTNRLFVSDSANDRVMIFDLSSGITNNGMPASWVLLQPDFATTTTNTACGGGASGSVNPCGAFRPSGVAYRASTKQLFVGDRFNGRVMVFDLSGGITNGMAASLVLGQPDLLTGGNNTFSEPPPYQNAAFGCTGAINACAIYPDSLFYDAGEDLLFVGERNNNRLMVFGANVGGSPVEATGNAVSIITTTNPDGSKTFTVTDTLGKTYQVTFPSGTTPLSGQTSVTLQVTASSSNPKITVSAQLPAGQTKTVSLPRGSGTGNKLCVNDQPGAGATLGGSSCGGTLVRIPAAGQSCSYPSSQCTGLSSGQTISTSADNTTITVSGLHNTVLEVVNDADDDGVIDEEDHCLNTDTAGPIPTVGLRPNHLGDDEVILGCNASQILACKPGQNEGERKFGLTPGSQNIFLSKTSAQPIGWAQQCLVMYPNP